MRPAIAAIGMLIVLPACSLTLGTAADTTTTTTRPTTTTSTTTTTTTTAPAPAQDSYPLEGEYQRALEYLGNYCWSDCTRAYPDTLDRYIDNADGLDLRDATITLSALAYWELDGFCDEFWARSDQELLDLYYADVYMDDDAIMAVSWFTCDS